MQLSIRACRIQPLFFSEIWNVVALCRAEDEVEEMSHVSQILSSGGSRL
jgi:hypothetical protein